MHSEKERERGTRETESTDRYADRYAEIEERRKGGERSVRTW